MFYLDEQLNRYYVGRAFSYGQLNFTKAGANHDNFVSLGFTPVEVQPRPDDRFYIVGNVNDDGTYNYEPRELAELKTNFIDELKTRALSLLEPTNWYVIAHAELGEEIPSEVQAFRMAVRSAWSSHKALLEGAYSLEDLKAAVEAPSTFPVEEV